ncbi:ester cyclase [Nocardia sp. NBC_00511]|uniref:ester cyclase n=1 Tax=Nocardia sp. NBC_00511 TaxID=2903591 RepID=UPI0030E57D78
MATDLSLESMKQFVADHLDDFVNRRNAAVIHRNMTPDFLDHDGPGGRLADLLDDEKQMLGMYEALPDLRVSVVDLLAEDDKVMCRNIWRWTDRDTGAPMSMQGFVLWRFEGRRIAERWATLAAPGADLGWARP